LVKQSDNWWDRNVEAVNSDISAWLTNTFHNKIEDKIIEITKYLPPEEPTANIYRTQGEYIIAEPVIASSDDPTGAKIYFDELCEKVNFMSNNLCQRRDMLDDWVIDSVINLKNFLPTNLKQLNAHMLRVRLRPVRKIASEYHLSGNIREFYPEFRAQISELAECGDDLETCLEELRRMEAEKITRSIPPGSEEAAKAEFDNLVAIAQSAVSHVDDSAKSGLNMEKAVADENAPDDEKRARLGEYGLAVRNFTRAIAKLGADIVIKSRDKFVDGAADGLGAIGKPVVVGGFAALVTAVANPVLGLAAFAAGYDKIDDALKLLKDYFGPPPPGPKT
jgi:hypothetical protein